jgi:hypothetical protein
LGGPAEAGAGAVVASTVCDWCGRLTATWSRTVERRCGAERKMGTAQRWPSEAGRAGWWESRVGELRAGWGYLRPPAGERGPASDSSLGTLCYR